MDYNSPPMKLARIFLPYAIEASEQLQSSKKRLVHYSTAENLIKIIRGKEFWLRRTAEMNDFLEIQHGHTCLLQALKSSSGERFKKTLRDAMPDVVKQVDGLFSSWEDDILFNTYIGCMSEEADREADLGRLSMWRAYGQGGGVAIMMPSRFFLEDNEQVNAFSSPVAYLDQRGLESQLDKITFAINQNLELLQSNDPGQLAGLLFSCLRFAVICTKHEGFREETEWRIVHTQDLDDGHLQPTVEIIRGIPQQVIKIPLHTTAEKPTDIVISDLIERIVVGPARSQTTIRDALIAELEKAGVSNANKRVFTSNIPLRS